MDDLHLNTPLPEFLYHGTSETVAATILRDGIVPRGQLRPSIWGAQPSGKDRIYLCEGYGPYFAAEATDEGRLAVIEVATAGLDEELLRPDEDAMLTLIPLRVPLFKRLSHEQLRDLVFSTDDWDDYWPGSLQLLGTCAYAGVVSVRAISRVSYFSLDNPLMTLHAIADPVLTPQNWQLCQHLYRLATRWYFGETISVEEWIAADPEWLDPPDQEDHAKLAEMLAQRNVEIHFGTAARRGA